MKKYLKFFLKLSVSFGFLAWIILKTDWNQVLFYFNKIDLWKLIVYVIILVLGMFISAYKWRLLARYKKINQPLWNFFRFYLTGTFINNFMPSFIGGDTYRAYQVGRAEKKYIEAASSVMADRITGLIGMTILALFFSLLNLQTVLQNKVLLVINLILIFSLLIDFAVAKTRDCKFWEKVTNHIPQKIARFIFETQKYGASPRILAKTIFWGMVFQVIGVALANYILFWALGIKISPLNYLSVIFLISIISSIPISINNIGLKEWAYLTFFGIYGLNASAAVTVAILSRLIQMLISFFALPAYLSQVKK